MKVEVILAYEIPDQETVPPPLQWTMNDLASTSHLVGCFIRCMEDTHKRRLARTGLLWFDPAGYDEGRDLVSNWVGRVFRSLQTRPIEPLVVDFPSGHKLTLRIVSRS